MFKRGKFTCSLQFILLDCKLVLTSSSDDNVVPPRIKFISPRLCCLFHLFRCSLNTHMIFELALLVPTPKAIVPMSLKFCRVLRWISCHGKNHSHTRCEYLSTIFLCYQHCSGYSLLGSKFSTNLLFAASKCHVTIQRLGVQDVQNGRTIGWLQWWNIPGSLYKEKRLQRKMTKDNYWIGVQEHIGRLSKS